MIVSSLRSMDKCILLALLVVTASVCQQQSLFRIAKSPKEGSFTAIENGGILGDHITDVKAPTLITCTHKCKRHQQCKSVFFDMNQKKCELRKNTVDGNFTEWKGHCSKKCIRTKIRSCTNPKPVNGGADCVGILSKTKPCVRESCFEKRRFNIPLPTVKMPTLTKQLQQTSEFAICWWCNRNSKSTLQGIVSFYPSENYVILYFEKGHLKFSRASAIMVLNKDTIVIGKWYHFCVAWNVQNDGVAHVTTYRNGILLSEKTQSGHMPFANNSYKIAAGNDTNNGMINDKYEAFLGQLMNLNYYTKKLSYTEVISDYHGDEINKDNIGFSWDEFELP